MIALAGVTIHSKIYESSTSLVYRGRSEQDNRAIVVKLLKQDYPSPQELTCYRQEYEITQSIDLEGVEGVQSARLPAHPRDSPGRFWWGIDRARDTAASISILPDTFICVSSACDRPE